MIRCAVLLFLACSALQAGEIDALVTRLDALEPAQRDEAFWTLVEAHGLAREAIAARAADERLSAQQRWALARAAHFIGRGYTRGFWRLAGDYLDGFEALPWRRRNLRLSRMARAAGVHALAPLRVVWRTDPASPVRNHARRWVAWLELTRLRPQVNQAVRAAKPERAVALVERLAREFPDEPEVQYQLACACALARRPEPALAALERAIALGFEHVRRLEQDPDLAHVRALPRFNALLEKIR